MAGEEEELYRALLLEETTSYNNMLLRWTVPSWMWGPLPHFMQTWLRNYVGAVLVYLVCGFLWCFVIYYWKRNLYLPKDCIPSKRSVMLQIQVAMKALPFYSLYAAVNEHLIEIGWTRCYSRISEVGLVHYLVYLLLYLIVVEFGTYWIHRLLHDVKPLYKHFHAIHHIYNKEHTLSPFAGLAFHPIDGILQASSHTIALLIVPTHFTSHLAVFFSEGLWTANIHDCIDGKLWPIMGAGYHIIHHVTYRHNYGHFTVFMDWLFGTLSSPSLKHYKA